MKKTAAETIERLRELYRRQASGIDRELTHTDIARRLGVSPATARRVKECLGLGPRRPGRKSTS